jgi:hypothetical protein
MQCTENSNLFLSCRKLKPFESSFTEIMCSKLESNGAIAACLHEMTRPRQENSALPKRWPFDGVHSKVNIGQYYLFNENNERFVCHHHTFSLTCWLMYILVGLVRHGRTVAKFYSEIFRQRRQNAWVKNGFKTPYRRTSFLWQVFMWQVYFARLYVPFCQFFLW